MNSTPKIEDEILYMDDEKKPEPTIASTDKFLNINVEQYGFRQPIIKDVDYPFLLINHLVTKEEIENAIDTVITYFVQNEVSKISVNLSARNMGKAPAKEVTLADVEKMYGCKVKIINE